MADKTRELLLGDQADQQAEYLLGLISEAAEGREVPSLGDVIQVGGGSTGRAAVRGAG
jgi:hypothetical protein